MAIIITTPDDQTKFDIVNSIIQAVARPVDFVQVIGTSICTTCSGLDPFCLTCSGEPNIEITQITTIQSSIKWGPSEDKIYTPNGQYVEGDCVIIFPINVSGDIVDSDHLLQSTKKVIVNNRSCIIDTWYYRGSPINRVYVILREDENLNGTRI